jgi:hypothetical protein
MPKNPEEERQSAAELITLLLQERERRLESKTYSKVNDNHIRRTISHVLLWKHSEAEGNKYKDCRYWSEGAIQSEKRYGKVITNKNLCGGDALRHEHLFPRKQLIIKLFSIEKPDIREVREILDRLNIAVIVTIDEDKLLGRIEGNESNPWKRYENAGVKVTNRCV